MKADAAKIAQLEQWLAEKEGETLEFKRAEKRFSASKLGQYCAALANEGGGKIILGVTDERPRQIVGSTAFDQPERTRKGLCEKLQLRIDFEEIHHPDCGPDSRVLVFHVPSHPVGLPVKFEGKIWARQQDSLVDMPVDRLQAIFAQSGHDFSAEFVDGIAFDDLDPTAIENFRQQWIKKATKAEQGELVDRLKSTSERGRGRSIILSRRYYEFIGDKGTYTRKKGLDREHNLALLAEHIDRNAETGSKLDELCQVIPSLPRTSVQSLLRTLKRRGRAHPVGKRKAGRWYPGSGSDSETD
jgi:ATP-dependent DNA helicase RecG